MALWLCAAKQPRLREAMPGGDYTSARFYNLATTALHCSALAAGLSFYALQVCSSRAATELENLNFLSQYLRMHTFS